MKIKNECLDISTKSENKKKMEKITQDLTNQNTKCQPQNPSSKINLSKIEN